MGHDWRGTYPSTADVALIIVFHPPIVSGTIQVWNFKIKILDEQTNFNPTQTF